MQSVGMYVYSSLNNLINPGIAPETHTQPLPTSDKNILVQWLGHASFLIKSAHLNIITDPVFSDLTMLFKRLQPSPISLNAIPQVDALVLSHNHRDHSDAFSLKLLQQHNPGITVHCPIGDGPWLKSLGFKIVREYSWWQSGSITATSTSSLMFLPTNHWSQRWLFDKNKSLWGSFMFEIDGTYIYFGGDSAYGPHYEAISKEFSSIDVALLPIAPCEPHAWLSHSHLNAEYAGQAWLELGARTMIPMHWGTFRFGIDYPMLAVERLQQWYNQLAPCVQQQHVLQVLHPGQYVEVISNYFENSLYSNTHVQNQQIK